MFHEHTPLSSDLLTRVAAWLLSTTNNAVTVQVILIILCFDYAS